MPSPVGGKRLGTMDRWPTCTPTRWSVSVYGRARRWAPSTTGGRRGGGRIGRGPRGDVLELAHRTEPPNAPAPTARTIGATPPPEHTARHVEFTTALPDLLEPGNTAGQRPLADEHTRHHTPKPQVTKHEPPFSIRASTPGPSASPRSRRDLARVAVPVRRPGAGASPGRERRHAFAGATRRHPPRPPIADNAAWSRPRRPAPRPAPCSTCSSRRVSHGPSPAGRASGGVRVWRDLVQVRTHSSMIAATCRMAGESRCARWPRTRSTVSASASAT